MNAIYLREKLERMTNPKSAADYGLGIKLSELMEFEEGRRFVSDFFKRYPKSAESEMRKNPEW